MRHDRPRSKLSGKPGQGHLDGQQRLVTLYGSLTRFLESSEFFPVYFDLREKKFKSEGGADWPDRLPMWTVLDVSALVGQVQALLKLPNGDALIEVAQDLAQRFQSYPVPILEIRQNDMDKIAPIFERINSTATRLTLFDFMVAALWTPKFNLKAKVNDIQESLEPKGFDGIVEETVVRAIATVALDTANRETMMTGLRARPRSTLAKEVTATGDALLRAVDFLSSDLYVVEDEILPYDRQLVLLAYIFHHRKHPNAAEIRILKRWFWRTSFSERYRRGGEGLFDEDLSAAREALKDPDVLDRFGDAPKAGSLITSMFRLAAAFTKGYVSLLASSHPKNLKTGQNIDVAKALSPYNRKQFHHIFPKAFLKKMLPDEKRVDSMVNMCMLEAEDNRAIGARAPSDYMGALRKEHGVAEFNRILESNLIPAGAWKFFATDDFDGFLKIRANYLETRLALLIHGTG